MKNCKKAISFVLVICMITMCSVSAFAVPLGERDQITGELYFNYAKQFEEKGITFEAVKALQNQGFSYREILDSANHPQTRNRIYAIARVQRPSNFVEVTNVNGSTEYYHPNSGMVAGDFYLDNNGYWITSQIESFITNVYGSTSNMAYMYYLFAEWDDQYQKHQGTDMRNTSTDPNLYSAHAGEVIAKGPTGRIAIYDGSVTHFYAHCTNIQVSVGDTVAVGDHIGTEGSVGVSQAHLHYEVRSGRTTSMGLQNTNLNSLSPYPYM